MGRKKVVNRKMIATRFKESDIEEWKSKASHIGITLTEYIERKVNARNNKSIFKTEIQVKDNEHSII